MSAVAHPEAGLGQSGSDRSHERLVEGVRRDFGRECMEALDNPQIVELMLNPDGSVWVDEHGKGMYQLDVMFPPQRAMKLLGAIAYMLDTTVTRSSPILEGELPFGDFRFEGLVPPVVRAPTFAIRRHASQKRDLRTYKADGVLTFKDDPLNYRRNRESNFLKAVQGLDHTEVIYKAIEWRKNILVVGSTGSGKTTLVNAVLDGIAELTPQHRIVLIEDTGEVQCSARNHVKLRSTVDVSMEKLLKATMRLAPTRICVGEVRGAEALSLLESWGTGHPGGVATIHANDGADGLTRMLTLCRKGAPATSGHLVAETVDLVVFIDKETSLKAGRKVREVAVVDGFDEAKQAFNVTRV